MTEPEFFVTLQRKQKTNYLPHINDLGATVSRFSLKPMPPPKNQFFTNMRRTFQAKRERQLKNQGRFQLKMEKLQKLEIAPRPWLQRTLNTEEFILPVVDNELG